MLGNFWPYKGTKTVTYKGRGRLNGLALETFLAMASAHHQGSQEDKEGKLMRIKYNYVKIVKYQDK